MPEPEFDLERIPHSKRGAASDNDARHAAVRRLILESAKHLFARFGYEGTTIGAIAHAIDLPPEVVLAHFDDKLDILMAVFDEGWTAINHRLQDIVISSVDARHATLSMFAVMMKILDRDEDLARLLLFEGRRPHPKTGEIMLSPGYRWFFRLCMDLVVRGQKDGSFRVTYHPRIIASMVTGAVESLMRDRLLAEQEGSSTLLSGAQLMSAFDGLVSNLGPDKAHSKP